MNAMSNVKAQPITCGIGRRGSWPGRRFQSNKVVEFHHVVSPKVTLSMRERIDSSVAIWGETRGFVMRSYIEDALDAVARGENLVPASQDRPPYRHGISANVEQATLDRIDALVPAYGRCRGAVVRRLLMTGIALEDADHG